MILQMLLFYEAGILNIKENLEGKRSDEILRQLSSGAAQVSRDVDC